MPAGAEGRRSPVGFLLGVSKLIAGQIFAHFTERHEAHAGSIFVRSGGLSHPGPRFVGHIGIVDHFALADADIAVIYAFEAALLTERRVCRTAAARNSDTGSERCNERKNIMFK
jgi:hypothetical protein